MPTKLKIRQASKPSKEFLPDDAVELSQQKTSETLQSGMPDFYIPGTAFQLDKINISQ